MKPIYYLLVGIGLSIMALSSCQTKTEDKKEVVKTDKHRVIGVEDTISLKTFYLWRDNWEKHGSEYPMVKYYTMPSVDLAETLGEGAKTAVLFNGLDMSTDVPVLHLMIAGVDSTNHAMIDYAHGKYVYDVTYVCPPACDILL